MRVLVTGDRNWSDRLLVWTVLSGYYADASCGWLTTSTEPFIVIEGGAKGADRDAGLWVSTCPLHAPVVPILPPQSPGWKAAAGTYSDFVNLPVARWTYPADWKTYGRAAGPIRNRQMLTCGQPDLVLAFHDALEISKGTANMVKIARKAGVPVVVISHHP